MELIFCISFGLVGFILFGFWLSLNINHRGFSGVSVVKNLTANAGDVGLIPGLGRYRSDGLLFLSLSEFSTVYCDPHSQRLWHSQ